MLSQPNHEEYPEFFMGQKPLFKPFHYDPLPPDLARKNALPRSLLISPAP
jgi:hypothetical protein